MGRNSFIILSLFFIGASAETHVFWYKCIQNNYALIDSPGPNLPSNVIRHEGMIVSASLNQRNNAKAPYFFIGSGLDDAQGRCGFIWSRDLEQYSGISTRALLRAEFQDGWVGNAFCNQGPIKIRCGVVDFSGNINYFGGIDEIPDTAVWRDPNYEFSATMGFNSRFSNSLMKEETLQIIAPSGRIDNSHPSVLDSQFFEIDITNQVNWILSHSSRINDTLSGHYAIAFLVSYGNGNTGKVTTYSHEGINDSIYFLIGSDHRWTKDGNTLHLIVESRNLEIASEKPEINQPTLLHLGHCQPNPLTSSTAIPYNSGSQEGRIAIYSPAGKMVLSKKITGVGRFDWDAKTMPAGLYICRLTIQGKSFSEHLIVLH